MSDDAPVSKLYTLCRNSLPVLVMSIDAETPTEAMLEIDEALDTWLGEDLWTLQHDGQSIWDGDQSQLTVRTAADDEVAKWHSSRQRAIDTGEHDGGDEDWLVYLIPVSDPDDDADDGDASPAREQLQSEHTASDLFRVVGDLPADLRKLHLTFMINDDEPTVSEDDVAVVAFTADNAPELHKWWRVQCSKLLSPEHQGYWVVMVKQEITAARNAETGHPVIRMSMCLFTDGSITTLTAEKARHYYATAAADLPLPPPSDTVFVDFE